MKTEIYYSALDVFDPECCDENNWESYLGFSKLHHLKEVVSLDGILNSLVFEPDYDSKIDWEYVVTDGQMITLFFNSMEYVLTKVEDIKFFNLLAVVKEPNVTNVDLKGDFEFVGYDLIEKDGDISALTNCGGFDETFSPADLNVYGLISDIDKAKNIQTELPINNPSEHHADCFLYEVWRHKTIGRKNKTVC